MSNIVFLIGNGFDVGMGLPTQYRDFYELYTHPLSDYYPRGSSPHEKTIFQDFASTIDANKPHWSYYEKTIGEYARSFAGKNDPNSYIAQHENFQQHFYEYLATLVDTLDYGLLKKDPSGTVIEHHMIQAFKKILNRNFHCKVCKQCENGTAASRKACKQCENRQSCTKQAKFMKGKNCCSNCQKCADPGIQSTGTGITHTSYPSPTQCQTHSEFYSYTSPNLPLKDLLTKGDNSCRFLCFNYSTVLDKCLESLEYLGKEPGDGGTYVKIPKEKLNIETDPSKEPTVEKDLKVYLDVCHVHGKILKDPNTGEISYDGKPVMGVNDPYQIKCHEYSKNDLVISHLVKERISDSPQYQRGKYLLSKSDIIIIYGMSVGITDQCWWDLILERMEANPKCQLIVYVYDIDHHGASPNKMDDIRRDWLSRMYDSKKGKSLEIPSNRISFVINDNVFGRNLKKHQLYIHPEDQAPVAKV